MKYIIMCGGRYDNTKKIKHLSVVNGEVLVERTIRLLRENGIKDIAISSNNDVFEKFGVPVLRHENPYIVDSDGKTIQGQWFDAFYPTDEAVCYIFGDVYFSEEAIKTIVETETDDIEFFGSKKPFAHNYIKTHEEPFALKVVNQKHLHEAIEKSRELDAQHKFWRKPLVWELFTVIKNAPLQVKRDEYTTDYIGISDYTCDIDNDCDIIKLNNVIGENMIKVEVIYEFSLFQRFDELLHLTRKNQEKNERGWLYLGDTFECSKELADYLTGNNKDKLIVVKTIEIKPEIKEEVKELAKEDYITKLETSNKRKNTSKKSKK